MIPKYRAWDGKYMIYDFFVSSHGNPYDYADVVYDTPNMETVEAPNFKIMQSTGLKDKNGVEIYQDDVVNMCWSDEIGESHWGKITIKNPFDYCIEEARYLIHADELEVIGNIYENPELLEDKNEK